MRGEELTIFKNHSHRGTLVQNSEFTLWRLLIRRISEDTSIQQRSVRISNHTTNISRRVRLSTLLRIFQRIEVVENRLFPVYGVSFVDRVDGSALWDAHVGVSEDELSERIVHGETIHAAALHGDDQLRGSTVHGEASSDQFRSRP